MPGGKRQNADETLLTALACGATVEAAAQKAGVSRSTANRRLSSPEFRQKLQQVQTDFVRRTRDMLSAASLESVKTLVGLQAPSIPHSVRLGAARAVLELGNKFRETLDFEQRIAALEKVYGEGRGSAGAAQSLRSGPAAPEAGAQREEHLPADRARHEGAGNTAGRPSQSNMKEASDGNAGDDGN